MAHFIWNTITTAKLEESIGFYTELLGLTVERQFTSPVGATFVFMKDDNGFEIELISNPEQEVTPAPSNLSMGYEVSDLDATLEKARSKGFQSLGDVVSVPHTRFAFVKDPNGVTVQFVQRD